MGWLQREGRPARLLLLIITSLFTAQLTLKSVLAGLDCGEPDS